MYRPYQGRPHGVSHLIGLQVHEGDPFRIYRDFPMQEGWMISNEPGIYGHFILRIKSRTYSEHLGIRLEDNLLITKTGCKNLSSMIPRELKDIENLVH